MPRSRAPRAASARRRPARTRWWPRELSPRRAPRPAARRGSPPRRWTPPRCGPPPPRGARSAPARSPDLGGEYVERDRKRLVALGLRQVARRDRRDDPPVGEVLPVRKEVAPDGEVEDAAVLERLDVLEDPLPEGLLPHHR